MPLSDVHVTIHDAKYVSSALEELTVWFLRRVRRASIYTVHTKPSKTNRVSGLVPITAVLFGGEGEGGGL